MRQMSLGQDHSSQNAPQATRQTRNASDKKSHINADQLTRGEGRPATLNPAPLRVRERPLYDRWHVLCTQKQLRTKSSCCRFVPSDSVTALGVEQSQNP